MVTGAVERHGGAVTSYMGDGVMAVFGLRDGRSPCLRAVLAAQEVLARTDARRPGLEELYGRSFDVNVGMHFGAVRDEAGNAGLCRQHRSKSSRRDGGSRRATRSTVRPANWARIVANSYLGAEVLEYGTLRAQMRV